MTPSQFMKSVQALQDAEVIPIGHGWKTSLAKKLGVTRTTIDNFEREGTRQLQTDLAIAALLEGVDACGSDLRVNRIVTLMTKEDVALIEEFRFANRFKSRSDAIRYLCAMVIASKGDTK